MLVTVGLRVTQGEKGRRATGGRCHDEHTSGLPPVRQWRRNSRMAPVLLRHLTRHSAPACVASTQTPEARAGEAASAMFPAEPKTLVKEDGYPPKPALNHKETRLSEEDGP